MKLDRACLARVDDRVISSRPRIELAEESPLVPCIGGADRLGRTEFASREKGSERSRFREAPDETADVL